jgi:hypothetical protein
MSKNARQKEIERQDAKVAKLYLKIDFLGDLGVLAVQNHIHLC